MPRAMVAGIQSPLTIGGSIQTLELPNPKSSSLPVSFFPDGIAFNERSDFVFVAGGHYGIAAEYTYPNGKLVGTVQGTPGRYSIGIAIDRN